MTEIESGSVDMVLTSPPYDDLRKYNGDNGWGEEVWQRTISEIKRILKPGGVCVWVTGDKTKNGSESGSSFKQALFAVSVGLKLYDTMIYKKKNALPQNHNRYEQDFEYMFVFSKGKPKTFNAIKVKTVNAGKKINWSRSEKVDDLACRHNRGVNDSLLVKAEKTKGNIWEYAVGGVKTGHPATSPQSLSDDHIRSWSNEGDTVLDCFMGSGTVGISCKKLNRNFIGIEMDEGYLNIAKERIDNA